MSNAEIHGKLLENTITNHLFRLQLKEIHTLTKSILQLYETLPLILNNNTMTMTMTICLTLFTKPQQVYFQRFLSVKSENY
jgi:hypothetical protein